MALDVLNDLLRRSGDDPPRAIVDDVGRRGRRGRLGQRPVVPRRLAGLADRVPVSG